MSDCPQPCMCPTCYAPYMDEPVTLEDKLTAPDRIAVYWTAADEDTMPARLMAQTPRSPIFDEDLPKMQRVEYVRADLSDPAAIREAWEKAYWRMRSYALHDNDCKLNKPPHFNGPCSCGLTAALEEALALISKGATEPTEYERKVAQMKKDFPNGI